MSGSISRFALLVSKFRGSLVGSLVGDCLGSLPEMESLGTSNVRRIIGTSLQKDDAFDGKGSPLPYSTHTRMLRSVSESLLQCREFDRADLTQRLAHESSVAKSICDMTGGTHGQGKNFLSSPNHAAASERYQADTIALRTIPIAMFLYGDLAQAIEVARDSSAVFQRSRDNGVGAILHCTATHMTFQFDPIHPLNVELFIDRLMSVMAEVEAGLARAQSKGPLTVSQDNSSLRKLETIREMLRQRLPLEKAFKKLEENATSESTSVPAAIYIFLQAQQQRIPEMGTAIEQVLQQAFSLSRSGDALASLSCSLTGSFHGIEGVPVHMRKRCQGLSETVKLADRLALQFETQPGVLEKTEITLSQRV